MTPLVSVTPKGVNDVFGAAANPPHHAVEMWSMPERLRWVISSGLVESANAWSEAAGLSRQYVSAQLARFDAGKTPNLGTDTIRKLADGAGVDVAWLSTGVGEPIRTTARDDRYPNRALASRLVREDRSASESAITSVLEDAFDSEEDHPALWWADRMRARGPLLRLQVLPGVEVEDDVPPRGRR